VSTIPPALNRSSRLELCVHRPADRTYKLWKETASQEYRVRNLAFRAEHLARISIARDIYPARNPEEELKSLSSHSKSQASHFRTRANPLLRCFANRRPPSLAEGVISSKRPRWLVHRFFLDGPSISRFRFLPRATPSILRAIHRDPLLNQWEIMG